MRFCVSRTSKKIPCFKCHINILSEEVKIRCVRCNIKLHKICYDLNERSKSYTQCPNCNKIGTMGILSEDLNYLSHIEASKKCSHLNEKLKN